MQSTKNPLPKPSNNACPLSQAVWHGSTRDCLASTLQLHTEAIAACGAHGRRKPVKQSITGTMEFQQLSLHRDSIRHPRCDGCENVSTAATVNQRDTNHLGTSIVN
ncbi:hypothetical protein RRSWK_03956 [Rhodopirellula sp. SWK7]|nr:hypothetical protein RRSWK_03956 [Rhodopirellula sp. SWK7]